MSGIHPQGVAGFAGSRGAGHSLFGNRAESAAGRDRSMEMRAEIVINADTDDARVVVGERFGQISEWASATTGSSMDGLPGVDQVRTCHVAGFGPLGPGVVREPLVGFDPEARSLSYEAAERMPGFIVHAVNR